MAVLPPYSSHALPPAYRQLMLQDDSEIIDFYPNDFRVDVKGKRFAWLGEVLLPLIDPERLKKATLKLKDNLSEEEKERNKLGSVLIFRRLKGERTIDSPNLFGEVKGEFALEEAKKYITLESLRKGLEEHLAIAKYEVPEFDGHKCELLPGADIRSNQVRDVCLF
jgi:5'-3' exonuclease